MDGRYNVPVQLILVTKALINDLQTRAGFIDHPSFSREYLVVGGPQSVELIERGD